MKKKFFVEKSSVWLFVGLWLSYFTFITIMFFNGCEIIEAKIALIFSLLFVILFLPFSFAWKGGTINFEDTQFIYRESLFQRKRVFEYKDMEKLELQYTRNTGRYGGRDKTIFIYFKKRKRSDVHIEIQYEVVKRLIEKKPSRCQVKIEFYSLRLFSEKHRELLKDYLTGGQKKEIERLIVAKDAKRKKRTNK